MASNTEMPKQPGAIPPAEKVLHPKCPHCHREILGLQDCYSIGFPNPAQGVTILMVLHKWCQTPLPVLGDARGSGR